MDQPKKLVLTPSDEAIKELAKSDTPAPTADSQPSASASGSTSTEPATPMPNPVVGEVPEKPAITEDWVAPDPLNMAESASGPNPLGEDAKTEEVRDARSERLSYDIAGQLAQPQHASRRFLAAYITSILSALSLLGGATYLGYTLINHFVAEKSDSWVWQYVDFTPVHISVMTSMIVFGLLYLVTSQYVARAAAKDSVGLRDWRVYRIVYATFTATLLVIAASVIASLLYIPLAMLWFADDLELHQIVTQVAGGLHVLFWIGLLVWQERLVKNGKNAALQGMAVVVLTIALVVATGAFVVAGGIDERYDKRVASDLSRIQSAIAKYSVAHDGKLPAQLSSIELDAENTEARLGDYQYTVRQTSGATRSAADSLLDYDNSYSSRSAYSSMRSQKYQLCATFRTDTTNLEASPLDALTSGGSASFSQHAKGKVCFDRS